MKMADPDWSSSLPNGIEYKAVDRDCDSTKLTTFYKMRLSDFPYLFTYCTIQFMVVLVYFIIYLYFFYLFICIPVNDHKLILVLLFTELCAALINAFPSGINTVVFLSVYL